MHVEGGTTKRRTFSFLCNALQTCTDGVVWRALWRTAPSKVFSWPCGELRVRTHSFNRMLFCPTFNSPEPWSFCCVQRGAERNKGVNSFAGGVLKRKKPSATGPMKVTLARQHTRHCNGHSGSIVCCSVQRKQRTEGHSPWLHSGPVALQLGTYTYVLLTWSRAAFAYHVTLALRLAFASSFPARQRLADLSTSRAPDLTDAGTSHPGDWRFSASTAFSKVHHC